MPSSTEACLQLACSQDPVWAAAALSQKLNTYNVIICAQYLHSRMMAFDNETLYELHYQMITLGKVRCTLAGNGSRGMKSVGSKDEAAMFSYDNTARCKTLFLWYDKYALLE